MKTTLLHQIRERREALGLQIQEMPLRAGLTRQQYGKIEAGGNPRLNTLDQIAEGLDAALVLVPKDKFEAVIKLLAGSPDDSDLLYRGLEPLAGQDHIDDADDNPWGEV